MKRLSLSEITGIAEIIGSIAIVVSLIFVGLQVRQNTSQIAANSVGTGLSFFEATNNLTTNPETVDVVLNGLNDFDGLSTSEKAEFDGLMFNVMTKFFMARQFYLQGTVTEADYASYEDTLARIVRSPGAMTWWAHAKHVMAPDGRAVIDDIIRRYADIEPTSSYYKFAPQTQ